MTFVRPTITRSQPDETRTWTALFGAADARDGRSLDVLARALRLIALCWPAIMASRTAAMSFFLGTGRIGDVAQDGVFLALLCVAILSDGLIALSAAIPIVNRIPPNRRLFIAAPMVLFSSAIFELCAIRTLGHDPAAMLATTLGPAMLAMVIFGRRWLLSLSYGLGAFAAQIAMLPDVALAMPLVTFSLGVVLVITLEQRILRRADAFARSSDHPLTGERAKALLIDFERAGHGWFWETDRTGAIVYISERLATQIRARAQDLIGTPFSSLIATAESGAALEDGRTLGFHFSARTSFSEITVRASTAEERWWSISGQPIVTPFGQFLGFHGSGSDLTEMRRSQAEVVRLANVDSLTGLANRPQMMRTLVQALGGTHGLVGECALLLLDLDRFKEVNDTLGHPAGDALLQQVAQRLLNLVGNKGKVGRLGGDEFQIVLPGMIEMMALAKMADAVIHTLSDPYTIDGSQVVIGASIGIALAPADGTTAETLIRNADLALYAAKGDGRGQFRFFLPAMHAEADDRRQLEADLRHAITTGALHLDYQPVVSASTEHITGFEALIRWRHPTRGSISPAVFIPIAEDAGLIGTIGDWVLRTACADAVRWPDGTRVAVNVSPIQFANPALPAFVMSALAGAGLAAERLELEITESVFLADRDNTDGMFAQLKKIGVRLALDDFGTGYSALGYLKTAPFDKIKIDQSFVRGAAIKGSRNAAIVKSIVNLAEALGMETTAEGAETLDELDLIRSLGCSHVQGFVYGRPMSAESTHELLDANGGRAVPQGHKSSRQPRTTMLRTVGLIHDGHRYEARIRNISASGALVEGLMDVPVGTVFTVEFSWNHSIAATCCWSSGPRMGVEFAQLVDVERVRNPDKEPPAPTNIPDFYRINWKKAV